MGDGVEMRLKVSWALQTTLCGGRWDEENVTMARVSYWSSARVALPKIKCKVTTEMNRLSVSRREVIASGYLPVGDGFREDQTNADRGRQLLY